MRARRLTLIALFTAIAFAVYVIELQVPLPFSMPGMKLGLANVITLVALYCMKKSDAAMVLFLRVLLGGIFSAQPVAFAFSFVGGFFCYTAMAFVKKVIPIKQIWVCSVIGALFHNIGQICVAIIVSGTLRMLYYLPFLILSGLLTGVLTGLIAGLLVPRILRFFKE